MFASWTRAKDILAWFVGHNSARGLFGNRSSLPGANGRGSAAADAMLVAMLRGTGIWRGQRVFHDLWKTRMAILLFKWELSSWKWCFSRSETRKSLESTGRLLCVIYILNICVVWRIYLLKSSQSSAFILGIPKLPSTFSVHPTHIHTHIQIHTRPLAITDVIVCFLMSLFSK